MQRNEDDTDRPVRTSTSRQTPLPAVLKVLENYQTFPVDHLDLRSTIM
jgi:hypothetical protein